MALDDGPDHDHGMHALGWLISVAVLALAIFYSNLLVILAIIKNKSLHSPNNMFVAGLAVADGAFGIVGLPLRVLASFNFKYNFDTCFFICSVPPMHLDQPAVLILGLTLDRFFAIRYPFPYHSYVECKHAIIACIVLSIVSPMLVVFIPRMLIGDNDIDNYDGVCNMLSVIEVTPTHIYIFMAIRMTCLFLVVLLNVYIMSVVNQHRNAIRRYTVDNLDDKSETRKISFDIKSKGFKTEKMLFFIIVAFLVTDLPLTISRIMQLETDLGYAEHSVIMHIFKYLYWANSVINPIIYALGNSRIKISVNNILHCRPVDYGMVREGSTCLGLMLHTTRYERKSRHNSLISSEWSLTSIHKTSIASEIENNDDEQQEMSSLEILPSALSSRDELSENCVIPSTSIDVNTTKSMSPANSWISFL